MKTKLFALLILVAFACLPLKALAYERNFPAGSIIIPLDSFYQPEADGGQLEAYGLAYYLLDHQDPDCLTDAPTDPVVVFCQVNCPDGDTACEQMCLESFKEECEHTIAVTWVINDLKTTVDGVDLVIEDNTLPRTEDEVTIDAVVKDYDHAGGTRALTFNGAGGDNAQRITYSGSLFVIDVQELDDGVKDQVYALINGSSWDAVEVHVAQVPFAAPVFRDMRGTPPKIALMNSDEDKTKGNAAILESYLRLAGICSDSYEIVTPNEIAGLSPDGASTINPILGPNGPGYDFLWAPHWDSTKGYDGTGGLADRDDVVEQIQLYLKSGKGMLAECASIETFEHNPNGHFLTDKGFGHNGVDKGSTNIIYNDVTVANSQIGDTAAGFEPEGGHLHNWRPYQAGDPYNFDPDLPDVSGGDSVYNNTVKRFTTDSVGTETVDDDWDYFVGGYTYGNKDFGYVVYLGGHSYAKCSDDLSGDPSPTIADPDINTHDIYLEFTKEVWGANFTLEVNYSYHLGAATYPYSTGEIPFSPDTMRSDTIGGMDFNYPMQVDFTTAAVDKKGKKIETLVFRNTIPWELTLDEIKLSWTGGDDDGDPVLDDYGNPTYTVKWMVFVATSFAHIAEEHGGINVFAFDLKTGTKQWTFSSTYADSVNDIPGAVTSYDIDGDDLADRIFVGDMNGRMWEIALTDDPEGNWAAGESVHEAEYTNPDPPGETLTKAIPLFNAGFGNPISVSPAIVTRNGHVLLIFGTGGADWASNDKGYDVFAVDATKAGALEPDVKNDNYADLGGAIAPIWSLPTADGEKVWASPTISAGQIWIVTSFGTMESTDPKSDRGGSSNLRLLDLDTGQNVWDRPLQIGKVRGSPYISRKHVYLTAFNGDIIQLGEDGDFAMGTGNRAVLKSWRHR